MKRIRILVLVVAAILGIVIAYMVLCTLGIVTPIYRDSSIASDIDTKDIDIFHMSLLKKVKDKQGEDLCEKMYYDGVRLYMLVEKVSPKEDLLNQYYIIDAGGEHRADPVDRYEEKERFLIWNYVDPMPDGSITLVYKEDGTEQSREKIALPKREGRELAVEDIYKDVTIDCIKMGHTSTLVQFHLDKPLKNSSFQLDTAEKVVTGYPIHISTTGYSVVFPMSVEIEKYFSIVINEEDTIKYSIPVVP